MSEAAAGEPKFRVLRGDARCGPQNDGDAGEGMNYMEVLMLAEKLHRQFLDVVQAELDGLGVRDINNVRALILLNIGDAEMTAGELLWRGCYLGSNVSYNLRKLTETGYVEQARSKTDGRVVLVRNSAKGLELCATLRAMAALNPDPVAQENFKLDDLETCRETLSALQQFWGRGIRSEPTALESHAA